MAAVGVERSGCPRRRAGLILWPMDAGAEHPPPGLRSAILARSYSAITPLDLGERSQLGHRRGWGRREDHPHAELSHLVEGLAVDVGLCQAVGRQAPHPPRRRPTRPRARRVRGSALG